MPTRAKRTCILKDHLGSFLFLSFLFLLLCATAASLPAHAYVQKFNSLQNFFLCCVVSSYYHYHYRLRLAQYDNCNVINYRKKSVELGIISNLFVIFIYREKCWKKSILNEGCARFISYTAQKTSRKEKQKKNLLRIFSRGQSKKLERDTRIHT